MRARQTFGVLAAALALGWPVSAGAATPAENCEAAKFRASGREANCLFAAEAVSLLTGKPAKIERCILGFENAFARAEAKVGPVMCQTEGDVGDIKALIDRCAADVAAALSGSPPPAPCPQFPATGQMTCWDSAGAVIPCASTGQDGDIRAGADLSYTEQRGRHHHGQQHRVDVGKAK